MSLTNADPASVRELGGVLICLLGWTLAVSLSACGGDSPGGTGPASSGTSSGTSSNAGAAVTMASAGTTSGGAVGSAGVAGAASGSSGAGGVAGSSSNGGGVAGGAGSGGAGGQAGSAGATGDTWESFAKGFMQTYCVSCHNDDNQGPSSRDYHELDVVTGESEEIACGLAKSQADWSARGCSNFPPARQFPVGDGAKPADADRDRLLAWIDAGMP